MQNKEKIHHVLEAPFALHAPADFLGAPELSRADREAGKLIFVKAALQNVPSQNLSRFCARLFHRIRKGAQGGGLKFVFRRKIRSPIRLNLTQAVSDSGNLLVNRPQWLEQHERAAWQVTPVKTTLEDVFISLTRNAQDNYG